MSEASREPGTKRERQRLVFYGKGGVGKSTVAAHLAVSFRRAGDSVALLGCDPKQDSSSRFLPGERMPTLVGNLAEGKKTDIGSLLVSTPAGVDLLEVGGAEPGTGCAGRGVSMLCQRLDEDGFDERGYDVVLFDVLGDLVCGGFVAPLRAGWGEQVFVVSSEEVASLFVANNVAKVIRQPHNAAVKAGGIIFNLKNPDAPVEVLRDFAAKLGLDVIGFVHRDPLVLEAETRGLTAIDHAPDSGVTATFRALAEQIRHSAATATPPAPTPMDIEEFWTFVRSHHDVL